MSFCLWTKLIYVSHTKVIFRISIHSDFFNYPNVLFHKKMWFMNRQNNFFLILAPKCDRKRSRYKKTLFNLAYRLLSSSSWTSFNMYSISSDQLADDNSYILSMIILLLNYCSFHALLPGRLALKHCRCVIIQFCCFVALQLCSIVALYLCSLVAF